MDTKTKESLDLALKIKESECEMLNNTLMEMFTRDVPQTVIDKIHREVIDKMKKISQLREEKKKFENMECNYRHYDTPYNKVKTKNNSSNKTNIYDSIVKKKKLSYEDVYKNSMQEKKESISQLIDKSLNNNGTLRSNLFLVDLNAIGIPSEKVKEVIFNIESNKVLITIYDCFGRLEFWDGVEDKTPIINIIEGYMDSKKEFDFSIKHIGLDGNDIYTEKYKNATISSAFRSPLSYTNDKTLTITIEITYENVLYETNNK